MTAVFFNKYPVLAAALILVIVSLIVPEFITAQSWGGGEDFEAWKKSQEKAFSRFLSEEDRAFSAFLEREARLLDPEEAEKQDEKPKPVTPPVYTPPEPEPEPVAPPEQPPELVTPPEPAPTPTAEIPETVVPDPDIPAPEEGRSLNYTFFGREIHLQYPASMREGVSGKIDQKKIAAYWELMASSDYEPLVRQCEDLREKLCLNDWGYALFLRRTGDQIYRGDRNGATLFTWFVLVKTGYSTSLSFTSSRVYLLLRAEDRLYGVPYFSFGGQEGSFYLLSIGERQELPEGSLYTYDRTFPGADRSFDFVMEQAPLIGAKPETKTYSFSYGGRRYEVPVSYDARLVEFLEWYPQMEVDEHFLTAPSREAAESLARALRPVISGREEAEAANMLIRFVQTAFDYETDQDQFNREKLMNPDEILHYNRSDCDDRSIFYAYLVRTLLGLETAGLDYPGHLATAVRFQNRPKGDSVEVEGKAYLVCDPTYINADIGREMPAVKGQLIRAFPVRPGN